MRLKSPDSYVVPNTRTDSSAWYAPSVLEVPHEVSPGKTYSVRGVYLNGVSQGAMEGDDWQTATNYPLVRITNCLEVVANGIASEPIEVLVNH